jgi:hypothetical protein
MGIIIAEHTNMHINNPNKYKKFVVPAIFVLYICSAFHVYWNSPVKGSVTPADGALRAWVISKTDTLNSPVIQGNFMITNVKPGNYTLMLEGKPPYRDSYKPEVRVVDGQPTDVGVIEMRQ